MVQAEKDVRQTISSAATNGEPLGSVFSNCYIAKFEWTQISVKLFIDDKDSGSNGHRC